MRLAHCLLFAAALHGAVYEVGVAWLQRGSPRPAPAALQPEVEIELLAARPDPIAEAAPVADKPAVSRARSPTVRAVVHREQTPRELIAVLRAAVDDEPPVADVPVPPRAVLPEPVTPATALEPGPSSPAVPPVARAGRSGALTPSRGTKLVSAAPYYRTNPPPEYPIPSRRRGEEGVVFLTVVVQTSGLPASVSLHRSSGFPLLDRAALDAVRGWSFEPARVGGVPVSSTVVIPVRFSLSE